MHGNKINTMAFSNIQIEVIKKAGEAFLLSCESPEDLRGQVEVTYRVEGNSVLLHEGAPSGISRLKPLKCLWPKPPSSRPTPTGKCTGWVETLNGKAIRPTLLSNQLKGFLIW